MLSGLTCSSSPEMSEALETLLGDAEAASANVMMMAMTMTQVVKISMKAS